MWHPMMKQSRINSLSIKTFPRYILNGGGKDIHNILHNRNIKFKVKEKET